MKQTAQAAAEPWRVVGNCPQCGAPIFANDLHEGAGPPPTHRTCTCLPYQAAPVIQIQPWQPAYPSPWVYPVYPVYPLQPWSLPYITWGGTTGTITYSGGTDSPVVTGNYIQPAPSYTET